jgi:hypothetical protein
MAEDIEQKLRFIIESIGVKETQKNIKAVSKESMALKKQMLAAGLAIGGVAAALGLMMRSSSILSSVTSAMSSIWKGFIDKLLIGLMPVLRDVIDIFKEMTDDALGLLKPLLEDFVEVWKKLPDPVKKLTIMMALAIPVVVGLAVAAAALSIASLPLIAALLILAAAFAAAWLIIENKEYIFNAIQAAGRLLWDLFVKLGVTIAGPLVAGFEWLWDTLTSFANWIKNTLQPIWDAFVYAIDIVVGGIRFIAGGIGAAGAAVGGFLGDIGVPGLQAGGIVTSPGIFQVAEHGPEAVIPLDQLGSVGGGGGPVTINLIIDGRTVASSVLETLRRDQQLTLRSVI